MQASSSLATKQTRFSPWNNKRPNNTTSNAPYWSKPVALPHTFTPTVSINYQGLKATQYFNKFTDESRKTLLLDLDALRLPHPKRDHIVFLYHGSIAFSWSPDKVNKTLMNHLRNKINPSALMDKESLSAKLNELSISSLTLREIPVSDQGTMPASSKTRFSPPLEQQPEAIHDMGGPIKRKCAADQGSPLPPPFCDKITKKRFSDGTDLDARPGKRPKSITAPGKDELGRKSSDSIVSSAPSQRISVPPSPISQRSRSNSIALSGASARAFLPSEPRVLQSAPLLARPPGDTCPDRSSGSESASITQPHFLSTSLPPVRDASLTAPRLQHVPLPGHRTPGQYITPSAQSSSSAAFSSLNSFASMPYSSSQQPPSSTTALSASAPIVPQPNSTALSSAIPSSRVTSRFASTTYPISTTAHLKNQLEIVRAHIAQGVTKEEELIKAMKIFGASDNDIPASTLVSSSSKEAEHALLSARLQEVEKLLEAERRQRQEAEEALRDIERECRAPFVVPALLEAFVSISNLTSQAMRSL